jgi:hypothetical protein
MPRFGRATGNSLLGRLPRVKSRMFQKSTATFLFAKSHQRPVHPSQGKSGVTTARTIIDHGYGDGFKTRETPHPGLVFLFCFLVLALVPGLSSVVSQCAR